MRWSQIATTYQIIFSLNSAKKSLKFGGVNLTPQAGVALDIPNGI